MKSIVQSLIYLSFLFVLSCSTTEQDKKANKELVYQCDVENINASENKFVETNGKAFFFQNPETQSTDFAVSGTHSCKLFPGQPYGLTIELEKIKPDDYLEITVWRKSKNKNGVIAIDGGEGFYTADQKIIENGENGWHKIFAEYHVPPNFFSGKIKIYVWNNGSDTIYFDDLKIVHRNHKVYSSYKNLPTLQLHADEADLAMFNKKRFQAFETSVLVNSDEDYSNLVLFDRANFLNGSFRLKGDLQDHIQGQKWSFRIKLKKGFAWKNMLTFSVQNPSTRYFMHEWFAHKVFEQEDVLTTRYGFIPLVLNNQSLGIYAWEEHFEKQLVESKNRREGPIIRFDESIFWQRVLETKQTGREWDIDYFDAAKTIPFKIGSTSGDSLLNLELLEAEKLLYQYKNRIKPVSEVLDINQLAKYYALIDLTQAYHGFTWHNQRFYYNPVTCLLEPIAFDGYIEDGIFKRFEEPVTGLFAPEKIAALNKEELMLFQVFSDLKFKKKYIHFLNQYSQPEFIEELIASHKKETDSLSVVLQTEFPYYHFNFDMIRNQADLIQHNLSKIEDNIHKIGLEVLKIGNDKFIKNYTPDINKNLIPFQVQAYYNKSKKQIDVLNYQNSEITLLGVFINEGLPESFEEKPVLQPFNGENLSQITINVKGTPIKLLFEAGNEMFETEVSNWTFSTDETRRQQIVQQKLPDHILVDQNRIIFDGNYEFKENVVIPDSFVVIAKAGTKIDLINGASFISFAPLQFFGTADAPIEIFSSDNTANGFNVIQAEGKSDLKHVHFSGLSSLKKAGWQTPAATAFYESDVKMEFCTFANNKNCDDALNVVRSDFDVTNCRFENTFADAFDSDFCTGKVQNCTFTNIGNDAIDFSGSKVSISESKMIKIADKAISGGEHSTLIVQNCEIDEANIGIAAKDLSKLELDKIIMDNTVYGIVAFVKKPEYGSANITINNLKMKNNVVFHQIELGSTLTLNGKLIEGREKNLAIKLYQ